MSDERASLRLLLATLRKRCPSPRWAHAESMVREGMVVLQRESRGEAVVVIRVPDWPAGYTAVLYPEEGEWACDCGGADPCAHVVAAALALSSDAARPPAASTVAGRLRYEIQPSPNGVAIRRQIVRADGSITALDGPLASVDVLLTPGEGDLAVDRLLGDRPGRTLAGEQLPQLFAALAKCEEVRLRGQLVTVSTEPVLPQGIVEQTGAGFALRLSRDPAVTEVLAPGMARCDSVVRPIGEVALGGASLEKLPRTQNFPSASVTELVLSVLPDLAARIPVTVRAKNLPKRVRGLAPRVAMEVTLVDHHLAVLPQIVYGDPPMTRLEGNRLVYEQGGVPVRDIDAEVTLTHRLHAELGLLPGVRADYRGTDAVRFMAKLRAWSGQPEAPIALARGEPLVAKLTLRDDGFDLDFELPTPEGASDNAHTKKVGAEAVLAAWREGLDIVPIEGGGWAPLPMAWLREHGHRVADLLAARRDDGAVPRSSLPALAQLCDALECPKPPSLQSISALVEGFDAIPAATLPDTLNATLRPYQRRGVDWLCYLRDAGMGAVLADDMGLGKTLQSIAAMRGRVLVVAPRTVMHNWADELARFRPDLRVSVYHGANRSLDGRADVTLTTYAVLRLDAKPLSAVSWDGVIVDEAQAIKNPDSQSARAAYSLCADFRLALSGTPVENKLDELWSLFHFTNPGLLGGRGDFHDRYADAAGQGDRGAIQALRQRTRMFILRRLKRDVAPELPARTEVVLRCDLEDSERAVYDTVRAATRKDLVEALTEGGNTLVALEALLRLRQAACHPALVPGQRASGSSKLTTLIDALETAAADGHRALVFSQWTSFLDLTEPHLVEAGISFSRLDGSTRDRASVVAQFQAEGGPTVMLVSLKAGGTGINLTAADHVFLLDPWWNPAVEDQAADRAHRIGQHRPVTIYRIVAADTVEERILTLQSRKRALAIAALDGGEPTASLTRDDLRALLMD